MEGRTRSQCPPYAPPPAGAPPTWPPSAGGGSAHKTREEDRESGVATRGEPFPEDRRVGGATIHAQVVSDGVPRRRAMGMKKLLGLAAVLEAATGLALMIHPSLVAQLLFGDGVSGAGKALSRVAGIALLALGVACWPGREAGSGIAQKRRGAAHLLPAGNDLPRLPGNRCAPGGDAVMAGSCGARRLDAPASRGVAPRAAEPGRTINPVTSEALHASIVMPMAPRPPTLLL